MFMYMYFHVPGKVVSRRRSCPGVDSPLTEDDESARALQQSAGEPQESAEVLEVGATSPVSELSKIKRAEGEDEDVEGWQEVSKSLNELLKD